MKTKLYAFVEFESKIHGRYGPIRILGYVTESVRKKKGRVRVIGAKRNYYPDYKQIKTLIPLY